MKPHYALRILLVRHGQAEANLAGAFLGRRDDPLTNRGRDQAAAMARYLAREPFVRLLSSPLSRARESAAGLAATSGLNLEIDERLVEQDFGAWEGLTFAQAGQRYPDEFARWFTPESNVAPLGGESLLQVASRVGPLLHDLKTTTPKGATVLLVGHAASFQTLLCRALGIQLRNIWPFRPPVGSLTELQYWQGAPTITRLGFQP